MDDSTTMDDAQFTTLCERVDPEVLHAFAMAIWDAAWADASLNTPQVQLGPVLARFVQQVAIEHGARLATRQEAREPPVWLQQLQ